VNILNIGVVGAFVRLIVVFNVPSFVSYKLISDKHLVSMIKLPDSLKRTFVCDTFVFVLAILIVFLIIATYRPI